MRQITIHDTLTGKVQPLLPKQPGKVGIYTCGPTVYGRVHIGNARHFVVFSLLKRFLEHEGYAVTLVSNITDINDKIYAAAAPAGMGSAQLAEKMAAAYVADTDALGIGRPDHEPTATETMPQIIALIETLIAGGHAYEAAGDVYFSVSSYDRYGELSHRRLEDMDQGEGREGADRKREPFDFALWKATKPAEDTAWDSPWGRGRPGWHIECSAMAEALLGVDFEIHGGGSDLIFPHHENEAAQTGAAHGEPLARLWVHVGMLRMSAEKMSKSVGNTFLLHDAVATHGRDAIMVYFAARHYRQPVDWSDDLLEEAKANVQRLREVARRLAPGASPEWSAPLKERFFATLADDFNTPGALAVVWEWVREANTADPGTGGVGSGNGDAGSGGRVGDSDLREMLAVLALDNLLDVADVEVPAEAAGLLEQRQAARAQRDWAEADRLRDELRSLGWEIRDGPSGPELLPLP